MKYAGWIEVVSRAILAAGLLLLVGCGRVGEKPAEQASAVASPAAPVTAAYSQDQCKKLGGTNWSALKPAVFDNISTTPTNRAIRVWKKYHEYSFDRLRDQGAFLGVIYRTDGAADASYNILAGGGVTCVWVRHTPGAVGTAGTDDVVLVNANDGIEFRMIFLAMVQKQGDQADGHFELTAHHLQDVRGFVSGGIRSPTGGEIADEAWTRMTAEGRGLAVESWLKAASGELLTAGPWFPCSQFGCCKVQGS